MTKTFKTKALVLRKRNLLGKDILLTIFTEKYGKINVFAKGIKKITSRRLSHTQIGNLIKAVIYKKNERFYLQETELISAFSKIKETEKKIPHLYFYFFVLDRLLPEQQKEEKVYKETIKFLVNLSNKKDFQLSDLTQSINRLIRLLGYSHREKNFAELKAAIAEIINRKLPDFGI